MKALFFLLLIASAVHSQAAAVFWSFQTTATGNVYTGPTTAAPGSGTFTSNVGFTGTAPQLTAIAGTGGATVGAGGAGGVSFVDPNTGTNWEGGGTVAPGNSLQWGSNDTQNLTGSGFTVTLDTTGLTDLKMRFDVRSAQANGATGAPTGFSSISYRLDTGVWIPLSLASTPTWAISGTWQPNVGNLDFSAFDFLENQSNVQLQLIFNGGPKTGSSIHNMRIDNLLITAVPEPASTVLLGLGSLGLLLRRRRMAGC